MVDQDKSLIQWAIWLPTNALSPLEKSIITKKIPIAAPLSYNTASSKPVKILAKKNAFIHARIKLSLCRTKERQILLSIDFAAIMDHGRNINIVI